jgi:hypothetical protein
MTMEWNLWSCEPKQLVLLRFFLRCFVTVIKSWVYTYVANISTKIWNILWLGVLIHACNLNYLGSGDEEGYSSWAAQAKSQQDPTSVNSWVWWFEPVISAMWRLQVEGS